MYVHTYSEYADIYTKNWAMEHMSESCHMEMDRVTSMYVRAHTKDVYEFAYARNKVMAHMSESYDMEMSRVTSTYVCAHARRMCIVIAHGRNAPWHKCVSHVT